MAWFLVHATLRLERLQELEEMLRRGSFQAIQPQGNEIHRCLIQARTDTSGSVWWEEQCYCSPPLQSERTLVFDRYFEKLDIQEIQQGEGWHRIEENPYLFPQLYQE